MQKKFIFMRVSELDRATQSITFAVGAAADSYTAAGGFEVVRAALTALNGSTLTRVNAGEAAHRGPEVGEVTRVLADTDTKRITVVARVSDDATWRKLERGVCKGARVALWGSHVNRAAGQLMLVDAPELSDVIMRRDLDRVSETLDAALAAGRLCTAAVERMERIPAPPKTAGSNAVFPA